MKKLFASSFIWVLMFSTYNGMVMSSCSFTGTTESIFDFTSSTTNWYFPGLEQERYKIQIFSAANFSRLKEDMAAGQGEYLTSLATLMKVPPHERQAFYDLTQSSFQDLFPSAKTTSEEMLANLSLKLSEGRPTRKISQRTSG